LNWQREWFEWENPMVDTLIKELRECTIEKDKDVSISVITSFIREHVTQGL